MCRNRWLDVLDPSLKKGKWNLQGLFINNSITIIIIIIITNTNLLLEDELLRAAVAAIKNASRSLSWSTISKSIPGRSGIITYLLF